MIPQHYFCIVAYKFTTSFDINNGGMTWRQSSYTGGGGVSLMLSSTGEKGYTYIKYQIKYRVLLIVNKKKLSIISLIPVLCAVFSTSNNFD